MLIQLMHPAVGSFAIPLAPDQRLVIGRGHPDNAVQAAWDTRMSRRHACIWMAANETVWVEDLGSRNGSWVRGTRLQQPVCLHGDESVIVGETVVSLLQQHAEAMADLADPTYDGTLEEMPSLVAQLEAAAAARAQSDPTSQPDPMPQPAPKPEAEPAPAAMPAAFGEGSAPLPASEQTAELRGLSYDLELTSDEPRVRFEVDQPGCVLVHVATREAMKRLWERDLSNGGLFVPKEAATARGEKIHIQLFCPGGSLEMSGEVVYLSEAAGGVGLQVCGSSAWREPLAAYVEGRRDDIDQPSSVSSDIVDSTVDAQVQRARQLVADAERSGYYTALDIAPDASDFELKARIHELWSLFKDAEGVAPPMYAARLERALGVLGRITRVLARPESRLEYDFRVGLVRADERIALAESGSGPDLRTLFDAWMRVHPDKVDRSATLSRKAFAARQKYDFVEAIEAGRRAVALNPFCVELRATVRAWEDGAGPGI